MWDRSLRFRLLVLGLMPLLIAFPVVIGVVVLVGGRVADSLMYSNLRGNLGGARSYLEQLRSDTAVRVGELVKSERLVQSVRSKAGRAELDPLLRSTARGSGFDFLLIVDPEGRVLSSSTGVDAGRRVPDSHVMRQARIGVASATFELVDADRLAAFSPAFGTARGTLAGDASGGRALLINAAAHFPLAADDTDAVLVGGVLIDGNAALVEHMREIIYPVGMLPGDAEGLTAILAEDRYVAISRQRGKGLPVLGRRAPTAVADLADDALPWFGRLEFGGQSLVAGFDAIRDGDGRRVGMIAAGFPGAPYRESLNLVLAAIAGLLALTMLVISVIFLRAGRELTQRLGRVIATMHLVRGGRRDERAGTPLRDDELGQLTRHFDELLDTIAAQDDSRRAAQQTIADEASRRRALFEHERDGVAILNPDGSVFEANPKCAEMLGYTPEELAALRVGDWDASLAGDGFAAVLREVGPEGRFFETRHCRKDGSCYVAEVAISRARWADRSFLLLLQRDITERKAVERELEIHRRQLETLVEQRTHELNVRGEQLDAIFALSPDGFVSFDTGHRVVFVNPAFLRMTNSCREEIIGRDEASFSRLLAERSLRSAVFPGIAALRAARRPAGDGDPAHSDARRQRFELAGPGNRVLEVDLRTPEAGNVSQILYCRDVTHETEVERLKSEFLSTAAHELRTPMASIYGYAELLMSDDDYPVEDRREMLGTIYRHAELMSSIINELLDLARIEARRGKDFVLERLAAAELVTTAVASYKPPAGRERPQLSIPGGLPPVDVDRKKMQQAILNVLSNAYKYSPDGGAVEVSLRRGGERERLGIEIRDHGIGMTPEAQRRVCERFYRADDSGRILGTGLGMSIVKEIIEILGGEVEIASEPGAGTAVTLWLPAQPDG